MFLPLQPYYCMKPFVNVNPEIVYCDNHILVALKPAGWVTQEKLAIFCEQWLKEKYNKPGNVFLHAIHRLDRPASGLVLFARTTKALSRLNEAMRMQEIHRRYEAEVEGHLRPKEGEWVHRVLHGAHRATISPEGKVARLHYTVVAEWPHTTGVSFELETGRYHQVRVQCAESGHPIVGDKKYGSKTGDDTQIHLRCAELSFVHPVTKELQKFVF